MAGGLRSTKEREREREREREKERKRERERERERERGKRVHPLGKSLLLKNVMVKSIIIGEDFEDERDLRYHDGRTRG